MTIRPGIPTIDEIETLNERSSYRLLDAYSRKYLLTNEPHLQEYRWIRDAFRQWSRIYEYPYCYESIKKVAPTGAKVLDAGSGITFFPFFMSSMCDVTCVDLDDYGKTFEIINGLQGTNVSFMRSDLRHMPYASEIFDCIYCISVLEHTSHRLEILREFHRLLKPGGLLVLTFDISLNSTELGIAPPEATALIELARSCFDIPYQSKDMQSDLLDERRYTTKYVAKNKSYDLLPWPKPGFVGRLKDLLRGRSSISSADLTFCNLSGTRKP